MSKTQLEKIKAFNDAKVAKATAKLEEPTNVPNADEKLLQQQDKTTTEQVADKGKAATKTAKEIADEQEAQRLALEEEQAHTLHVLTDATSNIIDGINNRVNPVKDWIASQPTPGGILAVMIAIGFIVLVAIPVNSQGQTRAYLFWQSLVGRTHMLYREKLATGDTVKGSSANFGNTTQNGNTTPVPQIDLTHLDLFKFT